MKIAEQELCDIFANKNYVFENNKDSKFVFKKNIYSLDEFIIQETKKGIYLCTVPLKSNASFQTQFSNYFLAVNYLSNHLDYFEE